MFKTTNTQWLWTPLAESMHPERVAGQPVWEMYQKKVPRSWVEKGYVEEERA